MCIYIYIHIISTILVPPKDRPFTIASFNGICKVFEEFLPLLLLRNCCQYFLQRWDPQACWDSINLSGIERKAMAAMAAIMIPGQLLESWAWDKKDSEIKNWRELALESWVLNLETNRNRYFEIAKWLDSRLKIRDFRRTVWICFCHSFDSPRSKSESYSFGFLQTFPFSTPDQSSGWRLEHTSPLRKKLKKLQRKVQNDMI